MDSKTNDMSIFPPTKDGLGDGARIIATPKVETDDGFAEMKDFNNDEAWNDQCSEKVMGIVPRMLTFENFSMITHGELKKVQLSNMRFDISLVKIAMGVPPMSGPKEGDRDSIDG